MKVMLALVGAFLVLDASIASLLLFLWAIRGQRPDFLVLSAYGVASLLMVVLKTAGGVAGAIQLWRLKQSGRVIAAVVLAYNVCFTLGTGVLSGAAGPAMWGTVVLNAVLLLIVALPAARHACEMRVPVARTRPPVRSGARIR